MLSTTHKCRRLYKNRVSTLPPLIVKSKAFSKDNKLEGSSTPPGLSTDTTEQESGFLAGSILKCSELDL